jgi:hypothetical protein
VSGIKDTPLDDDSRRAALLATIVIGLLVTQQAAGRATRDALFLSTFPVAFLPAVMMASSAAAIVAVGAISWALARRSPFQILPLAAGLSAVMLLLEWALCLAAPKVAAVAVYLHLRSSGHPGSGFWSLVNERLILHRQARDGPDRLRRLGGRRGWRALAWGRLA